MMQSIKWVRNKHKIDGKWNSYKANIGGVCCDCDPVIKYPFNYYDRRRCDGYQGSVRYNRLSIFGNIRKTPQLAKRDAEKLAVEYLLIAGYIVLTQLKRTGLLDKALSEIGIDL